jgi:hypothetical protein
MLRIRCRCYEELNDKLPARYRKTEFVQTLAPGGSARDLIRMLTLPPEAIELVLVNGEPAGFDRRLADGDRISLYPVFESLDITTVTRPRHGPLRRLRFVTDATLDRLAGLLRERGFDVLHYTTAGDKELAAVTSAPDYRILLTRNRERLERLHIQRGYAVRANHPRRQLREVLQRFDLLRNPHAGR